MTAVAIHKEDSAAIAEVPRRRTLEVRQEALVTIERMTFTELVSMGDQLVKTGFLPAYIKTGAQCAAIIMTGAEYGMGAMRAVRSFVTVKGKVTEWAESLLARFKSDGGRAVFRELTEERGELWLRHPNGDEHTEVFTLEDAAIAGLLAPSTSGEPSMYVKYPKSMIRSRCITNGIKSLGWEAGGDYTPSDLPEDAYGDGAALNPKNEVMPGRERVDADGAVKDPTDGLTLAEALNMTLPGNETDFGGKGGKSLVLCKPKLLRSVKKWIESDPGDRGIRYARLAAALGMVADAKDGEAAAEAARTAKAEPAASAPAQSAAVGATPTPAPAPATLPDDDEDELPF